MALDEGNAGAWFALGMALDTAGGGDRPVDALEARQQARAQPRVQAHCFPSSAPWRRRSARTWAAGPSAHDRLSIRARAEGVGLYDEILGDHEPSTPRATPGSRGSSPSCWRRPREAARRWTAAAPGGPGPLVLAGCAGTPPPFFRTDGAEWRRWYPEAAVGGRRAARYGSARRRFGRTAPSRLTRDTGPCVEATASRPGARPSQTR